MATPAPEAWITKEEAAEILGVSTRQVERLAERGLIRKRFIKPGGGRRYGCTQYEKAAVAAIEHDREFPAPSGDGTKDLARIREHVGLPPLSPTIEEMSGLTTGLITLKELLQEGRPREPRAWLTLTEASEYSGLPVPFLSALLREGHIHAIGRGPATWRIQRASLDAYGSEAHQ